MFAGYCMDFIGRTHLSITFESRKVNHAPRNSKCGRSAPPKLPAAFPWQICHRLSPEHPSDLLTQRWNQKYSSNLGNISEKQKDKKYSYSFFARVFLFLGTKEWLRETGGGGEGGGCLGAKQSFLRQEKVITLNWTLALEWSRGSSMIRLHVLPRDNVQDENVYISRLDLLLYTVYIRINSIQFW